MADQVFRIRRKSDGLWSTGGCWPGFNKKGKIWRKIGSIRAHLTQVYNTHNHRMPGDPYEGCEVVISEYVDTNVLQVEEFRKCGRAF